MTGELRQEFPASLMHLFGQLGAMIGKKQKRSRGAKLLPHEQHWRRRRKEHQRGKHPIAGWTRDSMDSLAIKLIRHLIVILDIADKGCCRFGGHDGPTRLILPIVALSLIQKSALHH